MHIIAPTPIMQTIINWIVVKTSACSCNIPTDLVALESLLSNLNSSRSSLEIKFNVFTLVVVIGVLVDVAVVLFEFRAERREYLEAFEVWEQGAIPRPHGPSFRLAFVGLLGATLVAIGVAGELWVEEKIGCIDNQIQQADNARANLLEKEAGDAAASAERANKALGQVQTQAKDLSDQLSDLGIQAEQLRESQGARVFRDRAHVGSRLRRYTYDSNLKWVPLTTDVEYSSSGCDDCENVAEQIVRVLHKFAYWPLYPHPGTDRPESNGQPHFNPNEETFEPNVIVRVNTEDQSTVRAKALSDAVDALVRELNNTQIIAEREPRPGEDPEGVIVIKVGPRPEIPRFKQKKK